MHFKTAKNPLLALTALATAVGVAALTLNLAPPGAGRWLATGLLGLFTLLLAPLDLEMRWGAGAKWLYLAAQAFVVALLMLLVPEAISLLPILYFLLSAVAMMFLRQREGLWWIAGFAVVSAVFFVQRWGVKDGLVAILPYTGGFLFFGAFGYALVEAEEAREESQRLLSDLQEAHRRLQEYTKQAEELAAARERDRLARELHDTLGHRLTVTAVYLDAARRLVHEEPDRAAEVVGSARVQVREALSELRSTVATLRLPLLARPLPEALRLLLDRFSEATGIDVSLETPDDWHDLPQEDRLALYRVAQEALTNVQRHARASRVWVCLQEDGDRVRLTVEDDGIGIPPDADGRGFGLRGMRERLERLGGELSVGERPGGGTALEAGLPRNRAGGEND
jgi:signal transduction histidine kinase